MGIVFSSQETVSVDCDEENSINEGEEKSVDNINCELGEAKEVDSDDDVVVDNEGKFEEEAFKMVVDDDDMNVLIDNTNNYVIEEGKVEEEKKEEFDEVRNGYFYEGGIHGDEVFIAHGFGVMVWSGMKYVGQFHFGRRHGLGTMIYPNGDTYVGVWQFNKRHGRGMFKQFHGDTIEALWEDDCIVTNSIVFCLE